ncbi:GtrA family protein [Elongatibacter sediminis]|uniref:GtrA family protein n=1 Tax=Elongatibacter sediminis TaxID=3119006 RepID=A0AAW9RBD1_9GAMM
MKIVRYALVGGTAAVVDFLIFAVFAKLLGYPYLLVGALGFILATALNYFLSIRFVFTSGVRFSLRQEFGLVFLISGVGLALHQAVLYAGIGLLGWEMLLVKVLATGSVFFWNFGARAGYVFRSPGTNRNGGENRSR